MTARGAAVKAIDFAGSVLLGAVAIWVGCVIVALALAFIRWNVPDLPGWGWLRVAVVVSAVLEIWHRWRKAVGK